MESRHHGIVGSNDSPIANEAEDALGFKVYVDALTQFILECETPMTVAVQGDWGSGKTSLMNLVRDSVGVVGTRKVRCLWINTWQFSQFNLGDDLPLAVIGLLTRHMADDKGIASTIMRTLKSIARARLVRTAAAGAALISTALVAGKDSADALAAISGADAAEDSPSDRLALMRSQLQTLIQKSLTDSGADRVIVFVDDIDRLVPERAVELLEAIKAFLDLDGCVFVLACDYQVVSRGLRAKFGADSTDLKGKHFFDKIIQLPFSMPVGQIEISNYLRNRLEASGVELPADDNKQIAVYERLLAHSVGFNPRGLKRLTNCLQVLLLVARNKGVLDAVAAEGSKSERQRALFAALCLQTAFEPLYVALTDVSTWQRVDIGRVLSVLGNRISPDDEELPDQVKSKLNAAIKECEQQRPGAAQEIPLFLDALIEAIQIEGIENDVLEPAEVAMMASMLRFSAITATSAIVQEQAKRVDYSAVRPIIAEVQAWLRKELDRNTRWYDGVEGVWTAPIVAGLAIELWFGVNREGELCLSVDVSSASRDRVKLAREQATAWCSDFLAARKIDFAVKKGKAVYGVVFAVLEGASFLHRSSEEMKEIAFAKARAVVAPLALELRRQRDKSSASA